MIKITNGVSVFEVTRGAYDGIYSRQGYVVVDDQVQVASEPDSSPNVEKTEDEKFIEDMVEKPISQWNKDEVKRFASIKGIDLAGTKSVNEAKDLIKGFMESEM